MRKPVVFSLSFVKCIFVTKLPYFRYYDIALLRYYIISLFRCFVGCGKVKVSLNFGGLDIRYAKNFVPLQFKIASKA
jgi:hypothetical protein